MLNEESCVRALEIATNHYDIVRLMNVCRDDA